jgi:hypothetical protein
MSRKRVDLRASAELSLAEMPAKDAGSYNVCSSNQTNRNQTQTGKDAIFLGAAAESAALSRRFWSHVAVLGGGECWLCDLSVGGVGGHRQFTFRTADRQYHLYAHRVAWLLVNGPIPDDLKVCHRCDVPSCCNPAHLFLGTQADNLNDARAKGRLIDGLGARCLSDAAYVDILTSSRERGTGLDLARKHGVSRVTVSRIRNGHQGVTFQRGYAVTQHGHDLSEIGNQLRHAGVSDGL